MVFDLKAITNPDRSEPPCCLRYLETPNTGTCPPFLLISWNDEIFNCEKVCGRSIPTNPKIVAHAHSVVSLSLGLKLKASFCTKCGSNSAFRPSAWQGCTFSIPFRTWPRKGVRYSSGLHPYSRNIYLVWVSYPSMVDALFIVGCRTSYARKKARCSSVLLNPLASKGRGDVPLYISLVNLVYALCPVR